MNSNTTRILEIKKLIKKYGKQMVLSIDNYIFFKHKTYLLTGSNGAGKSTLIKLILNLIKPSAGSIVVNTNKIAYVPERFSFPDNISIYDFLSNLCRLRDNSFDLKKIDKITKWWKLEQDKKVKNLSKGMKQKVLIIQAIIEESDLYIFDEPLNGLDVNAQDDFLVMLRRLKELKKTIIVCSHYYKYYDGLFDYFLNIDGGNINEIKKPD